MKRPPNAPPKTPEEIDADHETIARAAQAAAKPGPNPRTVATARRVREVDGQIARATGKRYNIELMDMTFASVDELGRLIRDLCDERDAAVRKARRGF